MFPAKQIQLDDQNLVLNELLAMVKFWKVWLSAPSLATLSVIYPDLTNCLSAESTNSMNTFKIIKEKKGII